MGNIRGYAYLSLCILLWASIPVASKKILLEMDYFQMLFFTSLFSFLTLLLINLLGGYWRSMKNYGKRDYGNMIFLGFLGAYLYYILLYAAFSLTTAQEGFILAYTWPILVLILAFLILRERVTVRKIFAIILSFLGIIIVITRGDIGNVHFTNLTGDILALGGAFVFALFSILGKKNAYDRVVAALIYFSIALVLSFITMLLFSSWRIPSTTTLLWLLYNGILVNGVTYIWWFKALDNLKTHVVSTTLYLTPFISLLYISFLLPEPIMLTSLIGLVIIVIGILIQMYGNDFI